MQNNTFESSLKVVTQMRNLADTYRYTLTPVEPQEVSAMFKWQADVLEKALLDV